MTCNGVQVDERLRAELSEAAWSRSLSKQQNYAKSRLVNALAMFHYGFNPRSPKQLGDLLFGTLHLVGRGTSTDKENRYRIRQHPRTRSS